MSTWMAHARAITTQTIKNVAKNVSNKRNKLFVITGMKSSETLQPQGVINKQEKLKVYISPKKSLMKTLFINHYKLAAVSKNETHTIYTFYSEIFLMPFYIKEDISTKALTLFQGEYLLDDNHYSCEILLNKMINKRNITPLFCTN